MDTYRIAVIPGDGIGKETVPEGMRALEAAGRRFGVAFQWQEFRGTATIYVKHGRMMPENWYDVLLPHDAIFYGAVGWPATVPDHVSLWGSLIQFRRRFDQYVNLRPCRLMPAFRPRSPAARPATSTSSSCARTPKASIRRSAAECPRNGARNRVPGIGLLAPRRGPHPEVRVRARRQARGKASDVGDEVERHRDHDAVLGRAISGDGRALSGRSAPTSSTSTS